MSTIETFSENNIQEYKLKIASIIIPANVTKINQNAFSKCCTLKSIEFVKDSKFQMIDISAFELFAIESISLSSNCVEVKKDGTILLINQSTFV